MRRVFHNQLGALTRSIADMCDLTGTAMQQATQALLRADLPLAEAVISDHERLAIQAAKTESDAFTLLALQAPVAGDLRAVLTCLKDVADVDRMGVSALHVAETARRRHPEYALTEDVNDYLAEMASVAVDIGQNAKDVVLAGDPDQAAKLARRNNAMDDLGRHLFTALMDHRWPHPFATTAEVTLLGHYYERFAYHAVEIGRRVTFQATGTPILTTTRAEPLT